MISTDTEGYVRMNREVMNIGRPFLKNSPRGVRLCSEVSFHGETDIFWFEVNDNFAQYLTEDRCDAFVIACLYKAMTNGADIVCDAPVSRSLIYHLNNDVLPVLSDNISGFSLIKVTAEPTDIIFEKPKAAATGWTGGVDCMYTLSQTLNAEEPGMRLTHLLTANNGALESRNNEELLDFMVRRAENGIAKEKGLSVIGVNTNLHIVLDEHYLGVVSYRIPAVVLALQKLFSVYYHSSTYEFARFSFVPEDSAYYEKILMPAFSTENLQFCCSGGEVSRLQKLKELSDFPPAHRYLHPCIHAHQDNCGKCVKCIFTMAGLYAMGTLGRFREAFDVDAFEKDIDRNIAGIIFKKQIQHNAEALALLKEKGLVTKRAEMIARTLNAAQKVADRNNEKLSDLLEDQMVYLS